MPALDSTVLSHEYIAHYVMRRVASPKSKETLEFPYVDDTKASEHEVTDGTNSNDNYSLDEVGPPQEVERFDVAQLGVLLREHRASLSLSLRRAAEEANVSFSTFTRVEAGSQPDLASFTALCAWMGVPPSQFFVPVAIRETEPLEDVIFHLRNDPRLTPEASASISSILKDLYSKLANRIEPQQPLVACHLRAASTLRPGVSERLSSMLSDMHSQLVAKVADGEL